ncbi:hypothetical protein C8R44DRAFT_867181 [Mycena epipterygia]|nr:hypothetical protein C8R44DRAFT_867181 [Mycena epipterygia]
MGAELKFRANLSSKFGRTARNLRGANIISFLAIRSPPWPYPYCLAVWSPPQPSSRPKAIGSAPAMDSTNGPPPPLSSAVLGALLPLTTPVPLPSVPIELPDDAPEWLRTIVSDLTKRDLGCHYAAVITALICLKVAVRFDVPDNNE